MYRPDTFYSLFNRVEKNARVQLVNLRAARQSRVKRYDRRSVKTTASNQKSKATCQGQGWFSHDFIVDFIAIHNAAASTTS